MSSYFSTKKAIMATGVLFVLIPAGFYFLGNPKKENKQLKATVLVAEKRDIVSNIQTTGKVIANREVEIKCKASGTIIELPREISDFVRKGDLLLRLDPIDEKRSVRQSEMNLLSSQANLEKAANNLNLTQKNLEVGIATAKNNVQIALAKNQELKERNEFNENLALTTLNSAKENLKAVEFRVQDLQSRVEAGKDLFKKGFISENEQENLILSLRQAELELSNGKDRLRESEINQENNRIMNKAEIEKSKAEIRNNQLKLVEQENSLLLIKEKEQEIKALEAKKEEDLISLENAKQRLSDTEVFAPMDGVITDRLVQSGQLISSGISNVAQGTTVMVIADLEKIFVLASVDESDIGKIKIDQNAEITLDAFPGKFFRGKVKQIYTKGLNVSNVITFPVKIEIFGEEKNILKPEMTANLEITTATKKNILTVPVNAVFNKNRKKFVRVPDEKNIFREKEVETGISDLLYVEIRKGLAEGEQILADAEESQWKKNNGGMNKTQAAKRIREGMMSGGSR